MLVTTYTAATFASETVGTYKWSFKHTVADISGTSIQVLCNLPSLRIHRAMNQTRILTLAGWLLFAACQSKPEPGNIGPAARPEQAEMKVAAPLPGALPTADELPVGMILPTTASRKIIRNAQLRIRVTDFGASGRAIEQAVRRVGGQIVNANETRSDNAIENALTIRVPPARLDTFLELVLDESIFTDTKTITAEDVTRRYVDVEARIRSKKATEETYRRLLKQARSVGDVLKVEEQLARIREEREVQEADLRQLKDEVALSTVNLTYYQQTQTALRPEEPFYTQIADNLAGGFRLVGTMLVGVFYLLPLGLVGAAVVWLVARWRRGRRTGPESER